MASDKMKQAIDAMGRAMQALGRYQPNPWAQANIGTIGQAITQQSMMQVAGGTGYNGVGIESEVSRVIPIVVKLEGFQMPNGGLLMIRYDPEKISRAGITTVMDMLSKRKWPDLTKGGAMIAVPVGMEFVAFSEEEMNKRGWYKKEEPKCPDTQTEAAASGTNDAPVPDGTNTNTKEKASLQDALISQSS